MMRSITYSLFAVLLLIGGCKEISPDLTFGPPSGLNDRVVVVEEFTGAQCVFCPPGAEELENLLSLYQDNMIAISIHTGFFATPIPNKSKYDFRTTDGDALEGILGIPDKGYPSAIINRKEFPGEGSLHSVKTAWAGYIGQELADEAVFGLTLGTTWDPGTRALRADVNAIARENVSGPLRITLLITESGIVDYQKDIRYGEVPEYVHKHVLRDVISNSVEGDVVATGIVTAGQSLDYAVNYTLPAEWKSEKCEVVAFISDGNSRYIYQAGHAKVE
ncbi:MAG: Omp28-related outer membrane protein [Lewinellaceae bacterium]|nr:Omp28-related outer membrane protein [Saprospiraceae bacterium]MCB9313159.1 Omp28-related outer membrane protein [Lewinellaceae bacterium]HRW75479.1 Omp28-related outer membrane protein [Saprospiraceae bacterium]